LFILIPSLLKFRFDICLHGPVWFPIESVVARGIRSVPSLLADFSRRTAVQQFPEAAVLVLINVAAPTIRADVTQVKGLGLRRDKLIGITIVPRERFLIVNVTPAVPAQFPAIGPLIEVVNLQDFIALRLWETARHNRALCAIVSHGFCTSFCCRAGRQKSAQIAVTIGRASPWMHKEKEWGSGTLERLTRWEQDV